MLKKIIVGVLVTTVAVAVGVSIYNASAAPQVEAQIEVPTAAPVMQAHVPQVETRAANAAPVSPAGVQPEPAQTAASQNYAAGGGAGSGGYGGGRNGGQGAQTGSAAGTYAGEAGGGIMPGSGGQGAGGGKGAGGGQGAGDRQGAADGQGTGGASGRPAWAGQGQGNQP